MRQHQIKVNRQVAVRYAGLTNGSNNDDECHLWLFIHLKKIEPVKTSKPLMQSVHHSPFRLHLAQADQHSNLDPVRPLTWKLADLSPQIS